MHNVHTFNTQYPIAMQWWIHFKLQIQCFHQWARIDQWHRHCSPLHSSDTIWCEKSQDVFRSMWFYFSFTIWLSISDGLGSPWTFTIFVKQWKRLELKIAIYKQIHCCMALSVSGLSQCLWLWLLERKYIHNFEFNA